VVNWKKSFKCCKF